MLPESAAPPQSARRASERRVRKVRFEPNVIRALEVSNEFAVKCERGVVVEANSAALRLLGASEEEALVGRALVGFIDGDYAGTLEALLTIEVVEPEPVPLMINRLDGRRREALLLVHPARELGEGVTVVTGRDIDREKKLAKTAQSMDARFRLLVDGSMHLVCQCRGGDVVYMNQAARELLRFPPSWSSVGWPVWKMFGPEYREILADDMDLLADEEGILPVRLHRVDGDVFDAQVRVTALPSAEGGKEYMVEARDITALNKAVGTLRTMNETLERQVADRTLELARQKAFVENLLETLPNPVWWKDVWGRFVGYNPAFCAMHGIYGDDWIGLGLADVRPGAYAERSDAADEAALGGARPSYEVALSRHDGAEATMLVNKTAWRDETGQAAGVIGTAVDITVQKLAEAELRRLATTDPLTGAYNRRHFMEAAAETFALSHRHQRRMALMMLDIDHFKRVNDTYGHPAGDEVIKALARVCQQVVRQEDTVGRLGGEEFAVVMPETDRDGALRLAERLRQAIAALEVHADGHVITFTGSIGVAEMDAADPNAAATLARADAALYEAKRSGRNKVVAA